MMPSVEGRREKRLQRTSVELLGSARFLMVKRLRCRTQSGTPYGVGSHVDEAGAAEAEGFELVGGALFYRWRG